MTTNQKIRGQRFAVRDLRYCKKTMLKEEGKSAKLDEEQEGISFAYQESMTGWSLENPDHYLAVSGISLALSTLALVFPALNLLGLPGFLYASLPVYRKAYQELKKGEARVSMMVAIIMGGRHRHHKQDLIGHLPPQYHAARPETANGIKNTRRGGFLIRFMLICSNWSLKKSDNQRIQATFLYNRKQS